MKNQTGNKKLQSVFYKIKYKLAIVIICIGWWFLPQDVKDEAIRILGEAGRKGII